MFLPKISGQTAELYGPEIKLWRAVLLCALRDALGVVFGVSDDRRKNPSSRKHCTRNALRWFEGSRDFPVVCDMAGVDHEMARAAAMRAVRFKWGNDHHTALEAATQADFGSASLRAMCAKTRYSDAAIAALLETTRESA